MLAVRRAFLRVPAAAEELRRALAQRGSAAVYVSLNGELSGALRS
jgi:hypothetical protein